MKIPASVSSPSVPTLTWTGGDRGCRAGLATAAALGAAAGALVGAGGAARLGAAAPAPPVAEGAGVGWAQAARTSASSAARLENHPCIDSSPIVATLGYRRVIMAPSHRSVNAAGRSARPSVVEGWAPPVPVCALLEGMPDAEHRGLVEAAAGELEADREPGRREPAGDR